ncbi:thioredoxin [Vairimorpha necatrix]|uniref:Thioredoxin n=1 Tax=Vairimorpha necatrix TaxID=6039 RepID=A0AAX4JCU2_9MICR
MLTRHKNFTKFADVQKKISNLNKDVLLFFGSEQCPPCKVLSQLLDKFETNKDLVVFELKRPDFEDMEICKEKYNLTHFPTLIKVDKNMNKMKMVMGYKGEEQFEEFVDDNFEDEDEGFVDGEFNE